MREIQLFIRKFRGTIYCLIVSLLLGYPVTAHSADWTVPLTFAAGSSTTKVTAGIKGGATTCYDAGLDSATLTDSDVLNIAFRHPEWGPTDNCKIIVIGDKGVQDLHTDIRGILPQEYIIDINSTVQDVTISWSPAALPSRTILTLTDMSNSTVTNMLNTGSYRMKCITKPTRVKLSVSSDGTSAPSAPTNVRVEKKNNNSLYISWDKSPESTVTGYKVHYGTSSGDYARIIDVRNVTNYNLLNVTTEQQYHIAVTAYDATGDQSELSSEATATVYGPRNVTGETAAGLGTVNCQSPVAYESSTSCTVTPAAGYQTESVAGCSGTLAGTVYSIASVTYSCTVSAHFSPVPVPVNGSCGTANGQTLAAAPSSGLCNSGSVTAMTGNGPWSWSCAGENGGSTASCSANIQPAPVVQQYVVAGSKSGKGSVSCVSPVPAENGSFCTLTPATGYQTASASGCGGTLSGNIYTIASVTSDCTVSALFTQLPTPTPPPEQQPDTGTTTTTTPPQDTSTNGADSFTSTSTANTTISSNTIVSSTVTPASTTSYTTDTAAVQEKPSTTTIAGNATQPTTTATFTTSGTQTTATPTVSSTTGSGPTASPSTAENQTTTTALASAPTNSTSTSTANTTASSSTSASSTETPTVSSTKSGTTAPSSIPVYLGMISDYGTTSATNDNVQNRQTQATPSNEKSADERTEQRSRKEVKTEQLVTERNETPKQPVTSGQPDSNILFTKSEGLQDRFRTYNGKKTPDILAALCNSPTTRSFTQKPALVLSDGNQPVTLELLLITKDASAPNISLKGAKLISIKRSGDGRLVVQLLPDKGIVDPTIFIMTKDMSVESPITVVPPLPTKATEKGFKNFLAAAEIKQLIPATDLNGDGKYNYLDEYIYTVNYVVMKNEAQQKKSEKPAEKKNSSASTIKKSSL